MAYSFHDKSKTEINVVIFDLGGGTLDITLVVLEDSIVEERAINGHGHLGGEDFDNALVKHCVAKFKQIHGIDVA